MATRFFLSNGPRRLLTLSVIIPLLVAHTIQAAEELPVQKTDLLIVGGTESGCAAAVQAARMGVKSITIVNDIEWLGGQFTAESLVAIDENRPPSGYGNGVPFPRAGIFKELMDRIEAINTEKFGHPRPGNTHVITTALPSDAERAFRELLEPGVKSGQIRIISHQYPVKVHVEDNENTLRLTGVDFASSESKTPTLRIDADVVVDATDWGDVIRLSGAGYEYGPDLKQKYGEPLAPENREDYPLTDMNPITYNMLIEETDEYQPIPKPASYDIRNYTKNNYPRDPAYIYGARRIVDHYGFPDIEHPDVILLCFAPCDYPLDILPKAVVDALEATEQGASQKNIVEMNREQRQIVFEDAKQHSLGYLYYLQTAVHDEMPDKTHSFRRFKLSDDFGTKDQLPPKPYIRESIRLHTMHMLKQQETTGYGNDSLNFADCMFHDGVACFQFEYDFHPTKRVFLDKGNPAGPWQNAFRKGRTWGPPYSGLSLFPARSLIPENMRGLLGAQKNLGYTSIVSSAVRLHDQCMAIGQGVGALAAVAIQNNRELHAIPYQSDMMEQIWVSLCTNNEGYEPAMLWPWRDLEPEHPAFVAVNQLSIRKLLPLDPVEVAFQADQPAEESWKQELLKISQDHFDATELSLPEGKFTRGELATYWWDVVRLLDFGFPHQQPGDQDGDEIADAQDPLPFTTGISSWPEWRPDPSEDGLPDNLASLETLVHQFNFGGPNTAPVANFTLDQGETYSDARGYGWDQSLRDQHRIRGLSLESLKETFIFTRSHATWEYALPTGKYQITFSVGDSSHEQEGQNVTVEGKSALEQISTRRGRFKEVSLPVEVTDGLLTVELGAPKSTTNTCLNWLRIEQVK
ncbi:FAD dependent oxidoreductase [Polystyrenella longa]|uniref:FAD dependent oxidoreductase n=1 Tax=Polystyrenella longa TaxID=2528007 RepID=A0A518CMX9_9PLAN|nr:FAD-dependent oxidoreductase [Polystyrenella longa]QDU80582.1 FAD dependent oxidoreductase [Polystyrenella longa]